MDGLNRREVASRKVGIFQTAAMKLAKGGVTPNQISVFSIVCAMIGALGLYQLPLSSSISDAVISALAALLGIQGRLICNLLDGLVAIEGGKKTAVGDLYNEVPDRVSDTLLLVAAGVGIQKLGIDQLGVINGAILGVLTALAALSTAYVRVLGGSLGLVQSFRGPMAKQHRMGVLNGAVVLSVVEFALHGESGYSLFGALLIILIGSLMTTYLRLRDMGRALLEREGK